MNNNNIKAVFFDIDGTLVSFKTHQVPETTRRAIIRLREKGIKVFIATGRHLMVINNLGDLEFDGYVTLNGSCCFVGKDKIIYRKGIAPQAVERLCTYIDNTEKFPCIFVREKNMYINYVNEKVEHILQLLDFPDPPVGELTDALSEEVFQLIAFFEENQEEKIMQQLPECESTRWNPLFTDIVPKGGSKRIGIEKMLEYYGISVDETMAFGDGGNDIPMLKYAGIGIAMGNAEDEIKQSADYVTESVDSDGIEKALQHFQLI